MNFCFRQAVAQRLLWLHFLQFIPDLLVRCDTSMSLSCMRCRVFLLRIRVRCTLKLWQPIATIFWLCLVLPGRFVVRLLVRTFFFLYHFLWSEQDAICGEAIFSSSVGAACPGFDLFFYDFQISVTLIHPNVKPLVTRNLVASTSSLFAIFRLAPFLAFYFWFDFFLDFSLIDHPPQNECWVSDLWSNIQCFGLLIKWSIMGF